LLDFDRSFSVETSEKKKEKKKREGGKIEKKKEKSEISKKLFLQGPLILIFRWGQTRRLRMLSMPMRPKKKQCKKWPEAK